MNNFFLMQVEQEPAHNPDNSKSECATLSSPLLLFLFGSHLQLQQQQHYISLHLLQSVTLQSSVANVSCVDANFKEKEFYYNKKVTIYTWCRQSMHTCCSS